MTPTIKEFNAETGLETLREMTSSELKQYAIDRTRADLERADYHAKATEKAALLAKLGISESEAALLLS
jgi:hypothetical protein